MAGLFSAILLSRQGHKVEVRDSRPDLRGPESYSGRSVNFTLSLRGKEMLKRAGLLDQVLRHAVPLRGRMLHLSSGRMKFQPYGNRSDQVLHAVRRVDLHRELLGAAERQPGVRVLFGQELIDLNIESNEAFFTESTKQKDSVPSIDPPSSTGFDFFIGADGAFSKSQELLVRGTSHKSSRDKSDWCYKEFEVGALAGGHCALDSSCLHLWSRGDSLMCAIPNQDGTFVANLILPRSTLNSLTTTSEVTEFLSERFPDLFKLTPGLENLLLGLKTSDIVTTMVSQWHFGGKALLIGDACHAISPFLGQGMNAALEDAWVLSQSLLDSHLSDAISKFQEIRKPDTDALAELSRQHLAQLSTHLGSWWQISRNKAELFLNHWFPRYWRPIYSLVAHSTIPYAVALRDSRSVKKSLTTGILWIVQLLYFSVEAFKFEKNPELKEQKT